MKILTAAEMREVDRLTTERYGIPSLTLMENAGRSVAEFVQQRFRNFKRGHIVVLCGKGNNGGDGFVAARHLREMGATPLVFLLAAPEEMHGDAATNRQRWQEAGGDLRVIRNSAEWQSAKSALGSADIIVDALLGAGLRGPVEGLLGDAINAINRHQRDCAVVAVDIPSGLASDAWTEKDDRVTADHTITFTAPKVGMVQGLSSQYTGDLHVREIGSPPELIEEVGNGNLRWAEPRQFAAFAAPREPAG